MYHKANLNRIIADYTSQPLSKIEEDTDRDRYMSPLEARDYGIIDHIVGGDEAVFKVQGSLKKFPKVRRSPWEGGACMCLLVALGHDCTPYMGSFLTAVPFVPTGQGGVCE